MEILENFSLKPYNTFGIEASARYFASFDSVQQLHELLEFDTKVKPALILGGGSNLLFRNNIEGLVLKNNIAGIEIVKEDKEHYYVTAGAGENWHRFVLYCLENEMAGVENLSYIPGNVGAGPMQNIGAYGVELKDVFHELDAYHLKEKKLVKFNVADCAFGYRESIFKMKYKSQFAIIRVTFKLFKHAQFNTSYGAIDKELEEMGVKELTIQAISRAVINIRRSKLPDPAAIGNAGSFFKNPEVSALKFSQLQEEFPGIIGYPLPANQMKLAAGWMIERCGWKGYRNGDAGCHAKQALVLVNYGTATGDEIYDLSEQIVKSVEQQFGVTLAREVNVV